MKLYLIRHGKTEFNRDERMQGWMDSPLLPESIEDAKRLGKAFKDNGYDFDAACSSTLLRANNTAKAIVEGMDTDHFVKAYDGLKEMNFGQAEAQYVEDVWKVICEQFDYKDLAEVRELLSGEEMFNLVHQIEDFNQAESYQQFKDRVMEGLYAVIKDHKDDDEIFIVAHGLTIIALLDQVGWDGAANKSFDNLSVSCIVYEDDKFSLDFVNKSFI